MYFDAEDDTIGDEDEDGNDPEWIAEEEEDFREELDKDKDGKLNREEIAHWVIPNDYDHSLEETSHLFQEADSDNVLRYLMLILFNFFCIHCFKRHISALHFYSNLQISLS